MKKFLLLSLVAATCASTAMAEFKTPEIYPGASFQAVSADGHYALSVVYETVVLYNLVDGTTVEFAQDDTHSYTLGLGNCITADGSIFLGSTTADCDAAYYKNGEWHQLNVPDPNKSNLSNGITPDGSRICGSIGLNNMTFEEVIMQVPAYWDVQPDGTYGDAVILPYPTKDLFNETPQYVTAIAISDDGKTIVGQMRFSSGSMTIPVLYQQADNGEWSYSLPTQPLFNPNDVQPVENPGDGPFPPFYEDFMTDEEIAAFNAAVNAFYEAGDWEQPYPDFADFMSPENMAAYEAAQAAYAEEYAAWEEKFYAYMEYVDAVLNASPTFLFNNVILSTDGKYIIGTLESEDPNADPWSWFRSSFYSPCTIDIATGALKKIESETSMLATGVADGGVIYAYNGQGKYPMIGYVIKDDQIQTIDAYLTAINPEFGTWIKENLTHEVVTGFDPETYDDVYEELTYTGMPVSNPDMSVITIWNDCPWWSYEYMAEGVVFYPGQSAGLTAVSLNRKDMSYKNGALIVPDGYVSVKVYNISGHCVTDITSPQNVVTLNTAGGVYIAKGVRADGTQTVIKFCK